MLVPKKDRINVYSYLFKEGVICTKDDVKSEVKLGNDVNEHPIICKNLYVIKLLQSLCSRGYVRKQYSWKWYYYFLTESGVNYLREYLHLPADVVPDTQKVTPAVAAQLAQMKEGYEGGDKSGFRREKGGFGRGRSQE